MRVDAAGARTWMLAAIAGWAILSWLLAVFGMGGRIEPLADDPARIKPIPTLPAGTENRLGPLDQYAEIGARPLFSDDRRPKPFSLQGDAEGSEASKAFDYVLTGVMITPGLQLATLQSPDGSKSERVKLGEAPESHPAWRLSALDARSAVFDGPGEQRRMDLRVFDGVGGPPPTPVTREAPTQGSSAMAAPVTPPVASPGTVAAPKPVTVLPAAPPAPVTEAASQNEPTATAGTTPAMTEQAQMEAIRKRIQARRAQLREQSQPANPPAQEK